MLLHFSQFFYYQMKIIYENHEKSGFRKENYFDIAAMIIIGNRFFLSLVTIYLKLSIQYWKYDPFCYFILKAGGHLGPVYLMIGLMLVLLGLIGKFSFFLIKDVSSFDLTYNAVVKNSEQIRTCQRTDKEKKEILKLLFKQKWSEWMRRKHSKLNVSNIFSKLHCWLICNVQYFTNLNCIDFTKLFQSGQTKQLLQFKVKFYLIISLIDQIFFFVHIFLGLTESNSLN